MAVRAEVLVVGSGAAGACAAIEAARSGARVLLVDRFHGGGATALSGGVVYAGGGTRQQREAGVEDSPQAMLDYLRHEVGDAVTERTLQRFCETSADQLRWLEDLGVPFEGSLCPYKTSYPTNRHYLYYSGSETAHPRPAPRGHRTKGRGTSGKLLYAKLAQAVAAQGVRLMPQTTAQRLLVRDGRVVGAECRSLAQAPRGIRWLHKVLARWAAKPGIYVPALRRLLARRIATVERRYGKPVTIHARSVVLAAGGFVLNRAMMREHAPAYRGGLPLGTLGDDGSGVELGVRAGAATAHLDRVSAWRFISPPSALLEGRLVDEHGRSVCEPTRYGAAIGHAMITQHRGRAWLVLDKGARLRAWRQLRAQTLWFQRIQAIHLLLQPGRIDLSIRPSAAYPCPVLTLGGLVVDEDTGQVRRADGSGIPGLYAAGRTAVGVCSNSYVSGLSLADCVFSGRRAGRSSAHR
ncbi:3-oxo-5alpha-steroid 4-dehydrogenase [Kutzneria viridogrisea]|uniref:3-oxo-5alpha-steroid 4-dehydrogenase n=1 Tax=Kutzneria viridogrisea TaxID=47990 RepID=A0ABR6BAM1_9PSEU|nr:3-oxo-5alpha-steroid 4-dehydrogenase [Kutzneria viridogrisea]